MNKGQNQMKEQKKKRRKKIYLFVLGISKAIYCISRGEDVSIAGMLSKRRKEQSKWKKGGTMFQQRGETCSWLQKGDIAKRKGERKRKGQKEWKKGSVKGKHSSREVKRVSWRNSSAESQC